MKPIVVGGDLWQVVVVPASDISLVDRTGKARMATTDPVTRRINIASNVAPPLLDRVVLHEVAHAITVSHGLLSPLRSIVPPELWVVVEEWAVELVEKHAMEAMVLASESLGRPLCINGVCM